MKATFFYSKEQYSRDRKLALQRCDTNYRPTIDGVEYTEAQTGDYEHKSLFDDAVIVCVKDNLAPNPFFLEHKMGRVADTRGLQFGSINPKE